MATARRKALSADSSLKDVKEPRKSLLHYVELFERRQLQRKRLQEHRNVRGVCQKIKMSKK